MTPSDAGGRRVARRNAIVLACAIAAFAGCSFFVDTSKLTGSDAGTTGDASSDASLDATDADKDAAPAPTCAPDASFDGDPLNCGRCGHDCLGGKCSAGACQPTTLATGQAGTYWLALDDQRVYWTQGTSVRACPKTGCDGGAPEVIVEGRGDVRELSAGAGRVFWSECPKDNDGGVYGCPAGGCQDAGATAMARAAACFSTVAVDEANALLYFATVTTGSVYRCALDACSFGGATLLGNPVYYPTSLTLSGGRPYWLDAQIGLYTCTAPNCVPVGMHVVGISQRNAIQPPSIVGGTAVWATYIAGQAQDFSPAEIPSISSGVVVRTQLDADGGFADILIEAGAPTAAVADDGGVRFADFTGGAISYCPLDGCDGGAQTLAVGQGRPFALVQDDRALYWGNYGDGRIMRLAK